MPRRRTIPSSSTLPTRTNASAPAQRQEVPPQRSLNPHIYAENDPANGGRFINAMGPYIVVDNPTMNVNRMSRLILHFVVTRIHSNLETKTGGEHQAPMVQPTSMVEEDNGTCSNTSKVFHRPYPIQESYLLTPRYLMK